MTAPPTVAVPGDRLDDGPGDQPRHSEFGRPTVPPVDERDPAQARPDPASDVVAIGDVRLTLAETWPTGDASSPTGEGNRLWRARVRGDLDEALRRAGRPIAYGYLDSRYPLDAYQTVFGARPGSAEMAFHRAFLRVGQLASESLFNDPGVAAASAGVVEHVDIQRIAGRLAP